ncbi:MAG: hypothetical protein ACR2LC_06800 [Pyrinomonadaceae bacterium]
MSRSKDNAVRVEHPNVEHPSVEYERRDVNIRALVWIGVAFILTAILLHFGLWRMYGYFAARDERNNLQASTTIRTNQLRLPPEPQLQSNPEQDLARFQKEQNTALNNYGWMDKQAGVVKIPIERAIELTIQRGLPVARATNQQK